MWFSLIRKNDLAELAIVLHCFAISIGTSNFSDVAIILTYMILVILNFHQTLSSISIVY